MNIATVIYENSSLVVLARIKRLGADVYLTPATTERVTVSVYNATSRTIVGSSTVITSFEGIVFDELQTAERWREDETGYNLAVPVSAEKFPAGDTNYSIEFLVEITDGYDVRFAVPVRTRDLISV